MRKVAFIIVIWLLTVVLFLGLDYAYTTLTQSRGIAEPGIRDPVFHHAFKPYFNATRIWGDEKYQFFTNSLGFADSSTREVPLDTARWRQRPGDGDFEFFAHFGRRLKDLYFVLLRPHRQVVVTEFCAIFQNLRHR